MPNKSATFRTFPRQPGFTLLELMAAITVLGILLAIGVPSFSEMIRNNRTVAQTNEFIVALSTARSEATRRGQPVSVCAATADQSGCAGVAISDWMNGWLIFTDRMGAAGVVDAPNDVILQMSRPVTNGLTLTSNGIGFVRFGATGLPTEGVDITFAVIHAQCEGENRRNIAVERTGRVNTAKASCT